MPISTRVRFSVCRRISNRESARRLRKQRSEKLNTLISQQDTLLNEHEALNGKIAGRKAHLQRLRSEIAAMQRQLGEEVRLTAHRPHLSRLPPRPPRWRHRRSGTAVSYSPLHNFEAGELAAGLCKRRA
jgi:hypothetical protein